MMRAERKSSAGNFAIEIEASDSSVQHLAPDSSQRYEGIAFSSSGNIIAAASSITNSVFLYRRKPDGRFEDAPYCTIKGPGSKLIYPHDVAFAPAGKTEMLAVAQRGGSIAFFEKNPATDDYRTNPVFEIAGAQTRLNFSDAVAFVPPDNHYLAVGNLMAQSISFYRKNPGASIGFGLKPVFELKHESLSNPDGLAFSQCGKWLAVANHGNDAVSIFQRRRGIFSMGRMEYGPQPVTFIKDPAMRYPHSVAFTPKTNHLVVTNAGANHFSVYQPKRRHFKMHWSATPVLQKIVGPDSVFKEVNAHNEMEGGAKGVAIHQNNLAICSPQLGIKIYSFREHPSDC